MCGGSFVLLDSDNGDSDEDDNGGTESSRDENNDYNDCGDRDESSDVILAFIDDKEKVERPASTRSGRATTRRSDIFSFF